MTAKHVKNLLNNERGASIVIALLFFLICGIIGSIVVTAASVEARSVQTHKDLQQDEYTMQSAADLVAHQLGGIDTASRSVAVTIGVSYDGEKHPTANLNKVISGLGQGFWTADRTKAILASRASGKSYVVGSAPNPIVIDPPTGSTLVSKVYGRVTVDPDLNMMVELSLSDAFATSSPYNMTVRIQCTPTYDISGQLTEFTYGDNTVIEKTQGGAS